MSGQSRTAEALQRCPGIGGRAFQAHEPAEVRIRHLYQKLFQRDPTKIETKPPAWNGLLRWDSWQPLKLAYQQRPDHHEE